MLDLFNQMCPKIKQYSVVELDLQNQRSLNDMMSYHGCAAYYEKCTLKTFCREDLHQTDIRTVTNYTNILFDIFFSSENCASEKVRNPQMLLTASVLAANFLTFKKAPVHKYLFIYVS